MVMFILLVLANMDRQGVKFYYNRVNVANLHFFVLTVGPWLSESIGRAYLGGVSQNS